MIVKEALKYAQNALKFFENNNLEAKILISSILDIDTNQIFNFLDIHLDHIKMVKLENVLKRRLKFEPIAYILQKKEFYSLNFVINQHSLIPRPDSETLIDAVIEYFPLQHHLIDILDLGTGSGCLILTLLNFYTKSSGKGVDISEEALKIAKLNAKNLFLEDRVSFLKSDWGKEVINEKFDVIISNPPYIPFKEIQTLENEIKNYEPMVALQGGKDGLKCYKKIASEIFNLLKKEGKCFIEIGINQTEKVCKIFEDHNLECISIKKDLNGIDRCLVFQINS